MNRRLSVSAAFAVLLLSSASAVSLRGPDQEVVSVRNDRLLSGETPVVFVCAAGVRLPWPDLDSAPDAAAVSSRWERACAECGNLARRYAAAGFNMVRLPDLESETSAAPAARKDLQNEFLLACRRAGIRVWADPLHSVLAGSVPPEAAALVDDPATQDAWTNAVAAAGPAALLAAAWDPRLAAFEQRALRDWSRSFNPATGLRRCDDPTYALFGFSFFWTERMLDPDRPPLPAFFEDGLRAAWNAWLLEKYESDEEFSIWYGPFAPGESLASNSVPFRAFSDPDLSDGLRRDQERFLLALRDRRIGALLDAFRTYGRAAREAPRFVTDDGERGLDGFSTIVPVPEPVAAPPAGVPLLEDAFDADSPEEAYEAARSAAAAGARVLVLPCRDEPEAFAAAAQAFRAGADAPAALPASLPERLDLPRLSVATAVLPSDAAELEPLLFPASGLGLTVVRVPKGASAVPSAALSGADVRLQLCVRSSLPSAPAAAGVGPDAGSAPDGADAARQEPEGEGAPASDESPADGDAAPDAAPDAVAEGEGDVAPPVAVSALRVEASVWRPEGEDALVVRLRLRSEDTGKPVPFGLLASGPGLSKKICVPMNAAGAPLPTVSPSEGLFRLRRRMPAVLRFEPAPLGTLIRPGL